MKQRLSVLSFMIVLCAAVLFIGGCAKKQVSAKVPAPPAPPQPTVSLNVYPTDIQAGQSAKVTWQAQNATEVRFEPVGDVSNQGSQRVSPSESTTYRVVAKGPGGTADASARLTVSVFAPAVAASESSLSDLFARNMKDAFFSYDSYKIDDETSQLIANDARFLSQHPDVKFTVEGHCDERGSEEYNLALGVSRAEAVKQALASQGVNAQRITTASVGKEKPFCSQSTEECWHLNRRDHFILPQ